MIYVDTSAAFKLIKPEEHSAALVAYLDGRDDFVSSALLAVELRRGALRSAPRTLPRVDLFLASVEMVDMDPTVIEKASRLPDPLLRSLDAVHIATALLLEADVDVLVSYDNRMLTAARSLGIVAVRPT